MTSFENDFFIEFEQDILGSMLFGNDLQPIISFLDAKHFIDPIHRELFRAILLSQKRFGIINPLTVKRLMDSDIVSNFEEQTTISISTYLANLLSTTSAIGSKAINAARRVVEQWARITISQEAKKLSLQTSDPTCDVTSLIRKSMQYFENIISEIQFANNQLIGPSYVSISDAAITAIKTAEKYNIDGKISNITWGLKSIDHLTGGVQPRELILIGARPSMGKTTFALSVALRMAMAGHGVAFFSLEMDREKLGVRALSDLLYESQLRIPYIDFIRGNITQEQQQSFTETCQKLKELPLIIDDRPSPGISDIRIRSERIAEQYCRSNNNLKVVIIDHLSLIRPSNRYQGNRTYEIAEITATLKIIARELNVAVILLSQLNRSVENRINKIPQLADLRDSGAIEQDADTIAFLYRAVYYLAREIGGTSDEQFERRDKLALFANKMEFILAKQRNGPIQSIPLFADMPYAVIRDEKAS
ncbi:MAG: DNA helicase [Candidatus Liberibacter europaeus]|uniref:DNA 5'-3' helicase n=1 Tax=Candidatus Liberibacter europaeus TaxID=744859 RepID=A0A2T4VX39_9HYPH|nr:MAG: DNA helicase [Candidatus Liberibacter europaeus]